MKIPEVSGKNFAKLKFIGFFTGSVVLCVVIFSSFWSSGASMVSPQPKETVLQNISGAEQLLEINQLLHSKWIELEQLYDEHSLLLAAPAKGNNELSAQQITETELLYMKILDSVKTNNAASPDVEKVDSIVNTYRASLQNKQALHTNIAEWTSKGASNASNVVINNDVSSQKLGEIQNTLLAKNELIAKLQNEINSGAAVKSNSGAYEQKLKEVQTDLQSKNDLIAKLQLQLSASATRSVNNVSTDQKVRQLQTEVDTKNGLIAKLQQQLKAAPAKTSGPVADEQKLNELQKELQSKTAMIAKLQSQVKALPAKSPNNASQAPADVKKMADELEFLKWALRSEVSSNHALTADLNKLKQANANLTTQLKGR